MWKAEKLKIRLFGPFWPKSGLFRQKEDHFRSIFLKRSAIRPRSDKADLLGSTEEGEEDNVTVTSYLILRMSSSRLGWNSLSVWTSHSPSLVMGWRVGMVAIGIGRLIVMIIRTLLWTIMRMMIKMTTQCYLW